MSFIVNPRWVDIPEAAIFRNLAQVGLTTWGDKVIGGQHFLFGGDYAYPYSLPVDVVQRLAAQLNEAKYMTWYRDYNQQAMDYYNENGKALNQAGEYWGTVGDINLPRPEILPTTTGLEEGEIYIAIIGLFHLAGDENNYNHHLYIDLIDDGGGRIYAYDPDLYLYWGWDGMTSDQVRTTSPVRIDKPPGEPGANIGMDWGQVVYGFHINNMACDRFRNVHIRYPDSGPGNSQGHHSHYIVLQRRKYHSDTTPPPPPPPPPPDPGPVITSALTGEVQVMVNQAWIAGLQANEQGNVTFIVRIKDA